ncbi:MAG: CHASE2 domain-containing protein [Solirubrobacterales bacterium]
MGVRGARGWQLAAVVLASAALGLVFWATDTFENLEFDTVDARFDLRGEEAPRDDIVLVGIGTSTFNELRRFPFPRDFHADVIDALVAEGAAAIAYDIQFTEPSGDPVADNALIRSVGRASNVVLSTTEVSADGRTNVFGGDFVLRRLGARAGSTLLPGESDGVIRRVPRSQSGLESFAIATVEAWRGREVGDEFEGDSEWIDFHGEPGTFDAIPFWRVKEGRFDPGTFTDKVVVIGATAPSLQDLHTTSVTDEELMSGPEIQANAISTVDRGNPLEDTGGALDAVLIVLAAAAAPLASAAFSLLRALGIALGIGALYVLATVLAFNADLILPFVHPLGTLVLALVGTLAVQYLATAFERQRVRNIFSRFVHEDVVDDVLARTDDDLRLGGVQLEGTILFSDIRGFTSFSETQPAERVVEILNRYLGAMSDAIIDHGGTITAYIGDGIMAVFGAPVEYPDHAERALAAARSMLEQKLPEFNEWLRSTGVDEFDMGIGLNTGPVMVGNVGSDRRLEYTAIGDTVNTASRLEGMTKNSGHQLFVAGSTRSAIGDGTADQLVFVDELEVRGKQATVKVWSLRGA